MAGKRPTVADVMAQLRSFRDKEIVALASGVQYRMLEQTRIDTGWAHGNWVIEVGRGTNAVRLGRTSSAARRGGRATASRTTPSGYRAEMGPIRVTNRVPYITFAVGPVGASLGAVKNIVRREIRAAIAERQRAASKGGKGRR